MFAEQHHHHLGREYRASKESPPSKEKAHESESIRQFDLSFSFRGLPDLIARFGPEQGLFQCVLGVALNIWSLRQEMLGEIDTRELITLVKVGLDGSLLFQNDLFGQAKDLRSMYAIGVDAVPSHLRPRYQREADQAIKIFETLTSSLREIDFTLPRPELEAKLALNGFHEEIIEVSPSMMANIESLRSTIHSSNALDASIQKKQTRNAFVGPIQVLTGSPSHWSHHLGETIFVWASECIVFPDTKEICIRQNGKFGKGKDESLLPYLEYGQNEVPSFTTEESLMQFTNMLMEMNYRQPKVLLDFLVKQFGGIKHAGKIDRNIREGQLSIAPYMEALTDLFRFELSRTDIESVTSVDQRLGDISDLIKHQIARNEPKALDGLVKKYKYLVVDEPQLSVADFLSNLHQTAVSIDLGYLTKIDFSLLDCVAGTPMSLVSNMSGIAGLSGEGISFAIDMQFGAGAGEYLRESSRSGIRTHAHMEEFCSRFGMDAHRFHPGKCVVSGCHSTFVGECGVCPACEMLDNFGISRDWGDQRNQFSDKAARDRFETRGSEKEYRRANFGDALSAAMTGDWDQFQVAG